MDYTLPEGWPTQDQQCQYWLKDREPMQVNGENDWLDDESQFSNYEGHEL